MRKDRGILPDQFSMGAINEQLHRHTVLRDSRSHGK